MKTRKLMVATLLSGLAMSFVGAVTLLGSAESETAASMIGNALSNDRITQKVNEDNSVSMTLKTDTNYSSTRAYYEENVNVKNFSMKFTIDQFNEDGALRVSFLSSKDDFPMNPYGDGFGIYFWDETAWGHAVYSSLRADFATYKKQGDAAGLDAKVLVRDGAYVGNDITLTVWDYDANNLAISAKMMYNEEQKEAIGTYAKANLSSNFNMESCVLMITPDIDSRAHSYDNDIKLTVKEINGAAPVAELYNITANAGENGTVVASTNEAKKGSNVTFTITPEEGYEVEVAKVNGTEVTVENNTYTIAAVSEDIEFEVSFKEIEGYFLSIVASAGENGNVAVSKTRCVVVGDEITFTAIPDNFYVVDEATLNGIPVALTDNMLKVTVTEDQNFEVTFKKYSIDSDSKFVYGMWDNQKDRANVEIDAEGNEIITLGVKDGSAPETRLYSKTAMSISSFSMKFVLNQLSVDGGFRVSFMSTNDDYPMEGYGDGFGIYFWDETAWGHPEGTAIRSDIYSFMKDPADKTALNVWASRDVPYIGLQVEITVAENEDKTALNVSVKVGEAAYTYEIMLNVLPATFNYNNCYLLLTPEVDSNRAHSWEKNVVMTVSELTYAAATYEQGEGGKEEETKEYSISYIVNGEVIRTAYADEGDTFENFEPTIEGYKFEGWYLDEEYKTPYDYDTPATEDIVVYAKTSKKKEGGCKASLASTLSVVMLTSVLGIIAFKRKETK